MKIAFLTTQSIVQSTLIGRTIPLANEFAKMGHEVTVLLHEEQSSRTRSGIHVATGIAKIRKIITGINPFSRSEHGKKRASGFSLIWRMKINALRAAWTLILERPDRIVLVKPLPENTLAACLAKLFLWNTKVVLDVDDFELFANSISSPLQRAAIHASERMATSLSSSIAVATPFLYDHMHQMVAGKKNVVLIPTGLTAEKKTSVQMKNNSMLYLGSISIYSGHRVDLLPDMLLAVRKEIPDATLSLAGSGDDAKKLREMFDTKGLTSAVHYLGRFSLEDSETLAATHSVIVDPIDASIVSRAKSSFRTALALATGTPVVTSSIGIRTDLIPQELHEKFFATPEDAASYAKCVVALMKNPLTEQERNMLIERSKKYTWEQLAKQYHALLV